MARLPLPQISAYAYALGLVTMLLALPHPSVLTGIWAFTFQAGVACLLGCMVFTLRGRISGRMSVLPASAGGSSAALAGPKHQ